MTRRCATAPPCSASRSVSTRAHLAEDVRTTIPGAATLPSAHAVTGATTLAGAATLSSTLSVTQAAALSAALSVGQATTLAGAATLSSTLSNCFLGERRCATSPRCRAWRSVSISNTSFNVRVDACCYGCCHVVSDRFSSRRPPRCRPRFLSRVPPRRHLRLL
jgi:hypothetical protein